MEWDACTSTATSGRLSCVFFHQTPILFQLAEAFRSSGLEALAAYTIKVAKWQHTDDAFLGAFAGLALLSALALGWGLWVYKRERDIEGEQRLPFQNGTSTNSHRKTGLPPRILGRRRLCGVTSDVTSSIRKLRCYPEESCEDAGNNGRKPVAVSVEM